MTGGGTPSRSWQMLVGAVTLLIVTSASGVGAVASPSGQSAAQRAAASAPASGAVSPAVDADPGTENETRDSGNATADSGNATTETENATTETENATTETENATTETENATAESTVTTAPSGIDVVDDGGGSVAPTAVAEASNVSVRVRPSTGHASRRGSTTVDVVATGAAGGVGAFNVSVSIANGKVGRVGTVAFGGDPAFTRVRRGQDNQSVTLLAAGADTDAGSVRLARLTLIGGAAGRTPVRVHATAVGNESGYAYPVEATLDGTLRVHRLGRLVPSFVGPPTDPDDDGVFEDVNGDERFDVVDVQALFAHVGEAPVREAAPELDFNDDDAVNVVDVQRLFVTGTGGGSGGGEPSVVFTAPNQVAVSGTASDRGAVEFGLPETRLSRQTGVRVSDLRVQVPSGGDFDGRVTQLQTPTERLPRGNETGTPLTYLRVSHPDVSDEAIGGVSFTVRVRKRALAGDPHNFSVRRRHEGAWDDASVELDGETDEWYVYDVSAPGLSLFGLLVDRFESDEPADDDAIQSVELVDTTDANGDGYVSDFDVRVRADTRQALDSDGGSDPAFTVYVDGTRVAHRAVARRADGAYTLDVGWADLSEVERGEVRVEVALADDDLHDPDEYWRDPIDAATVTTAFEPPQREYAGEQTAIALVRSYGDRYALAHRKALNASWWDRRATADAEIAASEIRDQLRSQLKITPSWVVDNLLGTLTGYKAYQLADQTLSAGRASIAFGAGVEKRVVAIHLDSEYTATSYADLRTDLRLLRTNTDRLHTAVEAGNETRQQALLQRRATLLERTYRGLPGYVDDVHTSVVRKAASERDLRAYFRIRDQVEVLRTTLIADYTNTTAALEGEPAELAELTEMPTHGWRAAARVGGGSETVVDDTMDTSDDYTLYRVGSSGANGSLRVDVRGASVDGFRAELFARRPAADAFRTAEGADLAADGMDARSITVNASDGPYYLLVEANGYTGAYEVLANAGETPRSVPVSVIAREGPDTQRPSVTLVEGPAERTLETGAAVRVSNESNVTLAWTAWDDTTAPADLEYRIRVDNGTGFTPWGRWRSVGPDRRIERGYAFDDGVHRVQLVVRDATDTYAVRNVDVVVSTRVPQTVVATDDDPTSDTVYVKVLPDRRVGSVQLQYRPANDTDSTTGSGWTTWRNVTDTAGFGRLSFPERGEYVVRARAVSLAGEAGPWDRERITYRPPDTTPPTVSLVDAPSGDYVPGEGRVVRATTSTTPRFEWNASDERAANEALSYRYRVDGGAWSAWSSVPVTGVVDVEESYDTGNHTITVAVRDPAGNVAARTTSFRVDRTAPTLDLGARGAPGGVWVEPSVPEPIRRIELQYRANDSDEWRYLRTQYAQDPSFVDDPAPGTYDVRGRAVDVAGNVGNWTSDRVTVRARTDTAGTAEFNETVSNGGSVSTPTVGEVVGGTAEGISTYNAFVEAGIQQITGEMLLRVYVQSRDGSRLQVTAVEFTEEGNASISADLPGNLTDDDRLIVEATGEGTVVLKSLRLYESRPPAPDVRVTPSPPVAGSPTTLDAAFPTGDASVDAVSWDLDDDDEFERTGRTVNATFDTAGRHPVTARAVDPFGATNETRVVLNVTAPPTARITGETVLLTDETGTLSAAESTDPDGTVASYAWDLDADGTFERSGPTANVSFAADGNHTVRLRVTDAAGATATVAALVEVRNRPPNAMVDVLTETAIVGETVAVSAAGSSDPDGSVERYDWAFSGPRGGGGGTNLSAEQSFTPRTWGVHRATVTVHDDDGAVDEATARFYVTARPTARIEATDPVLTNESVTLDARNSTDPDGTVAGYAWDLDDDGTFERSGPTASVSYPDDGNYTVRLRVTDDNGTVDTVARTVRVLNREPNAAVRVANDTLLAGMDLLVRANGSTDPDGRITRYDLDAETPALETSQRAIGSSSVLLRTENLGGYGVYRLSFTVHDDDGATDADAVEFYVEAPPTARVEGTDPVLTNESATLDARNSTDPDGTVERYEWDLDGDGTFERSGPTANVSYPDDGNYTVGLRVTDNNGTVDAATRSVRVLNREPRVGIGAVNGTPIAGDRVTVPPSTLADPDGRVTAVEWRVLNESGAVVAENTTDSLSFVPSRAGYYELVLTATDDDGAAATAEMPVYVTARPVARLDVADPPVEGASVTFTGVNSTDADGTIERYGWDLDGDGTFERTGPTTNWTFGDPGAHDVAVRVTDDRGAVDVRRRSVTVANPSPTLAVDVPREVAVGETILATANASDPGGDGVTYAWRRLDTGVDLGTGDGVRVTPNETGTITLRVVANTSDGASASERVVISVGDTGDDWAARRVAYGFEPSLAVSDEGVVHLGYYDGNNVSYVRLPPESHDANGSLLREQVDGVTEHDGNAGLQNAIALASTGAPTMVYTYEDVEAGEAGVRYATRVDADWRRGWVGSRRPSALALTVNRSGSVDRPWALLDSGSQLRFATGRGLPPDAWGEIAVRPNASAPTVAFDASGTGHLAYYDPVNDSIRYGSWTGYPLDEPATAITDPGAASQRQRGLALAVNASGAPRIAYVTADGRPAVARLVGGSWRIDRLNASGEVVAVDVAARAGDLHVAYATRSGDATPERTLHHAQLGDDGWERAPVTTSLGDAGFSLALTPGGEPVVAYEGAAQNGDLLVARPDAANDQPFPAVSVAPESPVAGEPVTLNASGSFDEDGRLTDYAWDLDADGAFERTGERVTAEFDAGEHAVTLRVTDDDGAVETETVTVSVVPERPDDARLAVNLTAATGYDRIRETQVHNGTADRLLVAANTSAGEKLFALNRTAGALAWELDVLRYPEIDARDGGAILVEDSDWSTDRSRYWLVDAATGAVRWAYSLGNSSYTAATTDGTLLVEEDLANGSTRYHALDRETGTVRWRLTSEAHGYVEGIRAGTAYLNLDDGSRERLVAIDVVSGERRWSDETTGYLDVNREAASRNVSVDTPLYYTLDESSNTTLLAVDPQTGDRRWSQHAGDLRVEAHSADLAFVTASENGTWTLSARNHTTGERRWQRTASGWIHVTSSPNSSGSLFVEASTDGNDSFWALDRETGRLEWQYNASGYLYAPYAGPDRVVLTDNRPDSTRIASVARATGEVAWTFDVPDDSYVRFRNESLLVVTNRTHVWGLDRSTGAVRWTTAAASYPHVASVGGELYVGGDRAVQRIDRDTGRALWNRSFEGDYGHFLGFAPGRLYWNARGSLEHVVAVDRTTGAVDWRLTEVRDTRPLNGSAIVVDGPSDDVWLYGVETVDRPDAQEESQ